MPDRNDGERLGLQAVDLTIHDALIAAPKCFEADPYGTACHPRDNLIMILLPFSLSE